jgi:DnaA family protein
MLDPATVARVGITGQLCLDDLDLVCGERPWEEALFHLLNAVRDSGGNILVSARVPPAGLQLDLADLQSRLVSALVQRVTALTDREKEQAIHERAVRRGLTINDEAMRYIMTHTHRDMASLLTILDELDRETVLQQRRVTIPFVKKVLQL